MESVEPMDDSPEHVTQSAEDGDPIDIDNALAQDRTPSGLGDVADTEGKDQESMVTDENVNEMNEDEGSEVSESDSEESPESPPAQASVPMDQEYPVVDEEQSLNFRSPEESYKAAELEEEEREELRGQVTEEVQRSDEEESDRPDTNTENPGSPVNVPESSDYLQEKSDSCDETPGSPLEPQFSASSPKEIPYSPNEVHAPDSENNFDKKVGDNVTDSQNADDLTLNVFGLQDDCVKGSEDVTAVHSRRSSEGNNVDSTVNQDGEPTHQIPTEDRLQADSSVNLSPQSPVQGHGTVSGPSEDSKEKDEEDIYSLDLMGDDSASNSEAVARDSDGKTSQRFSDDLYNENKSLSNQGDVDSKVSQSGERGDASNDPHSSMHVPVEPVTGSSELSQGSLEPENNVHSTTTLPHQSDRTRESIDSDSIRRVNDSGERYDVNDIRNGVGEREDELRAGRVQEQSNTSFNEEHVELDYDEEEGEDMHSHAHKDAGDEEDKHKEGSADEKQDGELSSSEEEKDDGELDDDEDCEEGEIREPGGRKPFVKPVCRFYTKGNCTWGNNCRFLHPGVNDKGNYRLFETPGLNGGIMGLNRRFGQGWGPEPGAEPELPPPPPELPASESAWERGLRHAKEMRKKASMRKEQETNFEEKRMNLSLDEERDLNKENERSKYVKDPYYDQCDDDEYYGKSQIHGWQAGSYENFEVRWTREPEYQHYRHEKERERFKERHYSPPVERMERIDRLERQMFDQEPRMRDERRDKFRDDRMEPPPPSQIPRGRADEWHDPWQRSKSPKQKRRSSRSHSRGRRRRRSYSVSSHSSSSYSSSRSRSSSFSSRSSRSSYSRSSSFSSRSPSPRPTGSKKPGPHPAEKNQGPPQKSGPGKRGPPIDERKVPPQSRNNTGKRGPSTDERKGPQQTKNNDQPRSAVTVKVKQHSPDKRPGGPPGRGGRPGPGEDRGRRRDKPPHGPPHPRTVPRSGSRSSASGSSLSRSRSRSSSSSSFSRSGSASSASSKSRSRSRSSSTSSSGSADSEHLYRDLHSTDGRNISPKKKIPGRVPRPDRGGPRHDHPPRRRDVDHDRDRRDDRSRHEGRSGMRGNRQPHGRQAAAPLKPKDPLKLVGQKSNIKLTLLNKPAEKSNLVPGGPPVKRRPSDSGSGPAPKRQALLSPPGAKPPAAEKPKAVPRPEKMKSPPAKEKPISPTKAPTKTAPSAGKAPAGPKLPVPGAPAVIPPPPAPAVKQKKSMSSRREELLKQLKAVEDAIARKKAKMQ